jgi:ATP-dependent Clp protease protease subunit
MSYPLPVVIEKDGTNEKAYDLYSRLLKDRIIFVGTPINDQVANAIIAQLLFLEADDPDKDIYMYINSPGGSVNAGMGIYDTMQYVKPQITTVCIGQAMSMGCFLLSGGTKGKRFALPHARIMMHSVQSGFQGASPDVRIQAAEGDFLENQLFVLLALHTGQPLESIQKDFEREVFMTPGEAKEYGIIDAIHAESSRESKDE